MLPILMSLLPWSAGAQAGQRRWSPTAAEVLWSPYTWKQEPTANGATAAEACMPGAYLRLRVRGTTRLGLSIDAGALLGSPSGTTPIIEYALDDGPYATARLSDAGDVCDVLLAEGLAPHDEHELHLVFRAGTLHERWHSCRPRLRITGFLTDAQGQLLAVARRARHIIGWGDSITEGVGVDALFTGWNDLLPNHARGTWLPVVAQVLDAEYGQLGTGGQSLSAAIPGGLPPLGATWSVYDASQASRLAADRLSPQPDAIFCNMGTNDRVDPTADYARWLAAVRQAAPQAWLFVVVPINGFWRGPITTLVMHLRQADARLVLIDCPQLQAGAPAHGRPSSLAYDGVHPTLHGEALFGALIAAQAQRAWMQPP